VVVGPGAGTGRRGMGTGVGMGMGMGMGVGMGGMGMGGMGGRGMRGAGSALKMGILDSFKKIVGKITYTSIKPTLSIWHLPTPYLNPPSLYDTYTLNPHLYDIWHMTPVGAGDALEALALENDKALKGYMQRVEQVSIYREYRV
jgi:hypothetical protein